MRFMPFFWDRSKNKLAFLKKTTFRSSKISLGKIMSIFMGNKSLIKWVKFTDDLTLIFKFSRDFSKMLRNFPVFSSNQLIKISMQESSFWYSVFSVDDLQYVARNNLYGWEDFSRLAFGRLAKSANVVVDAGAYSGIYSLIALSCNPTVKVYSYEPYPIMNKVLSTNIQLNDFEDRCSISNLALSNVSGPGRLFIKPANLKTSFASMENSEGEIVNIKTAKLDDLLGFERLDLLKMDIEGHELKALEGSYSAILRCKPICFIEALDIATYDKIKNFFVSLGYPLPLKLDSRNFLFGSESVIKLVSVWKNELLKSVKAL